MITNMVAIFSSLLGSSPPESPRDPAAEMHGHKLATLASARERADADGNRMPTLEDYRIACEQLGAELGLPAEDWNPKSYANLSGMDITGFQISDPGPITTNLYDQDGDHTVNDFYNSISFNNAKLANCIIDPATSFNAQLANVKSMDHVTFKNMSENSLALGNGTFSHLTFENFTGGDVSFHGSQVDGLNMQNQKITSLTMDSRSSIANLQADNAGIVEINGQPNASISDASFQHATLSSNGSMQGMQLTNVDFTGANLDNLNLQGAILNDVDFSHAYVAGLNLHGATLNNVTLPAAGTDRINLTGTTMNNVTLDNGSAINSPQQLLVQGVAIDDSTTIHSSREARNSTATSAAPSQFAGIKELAGLNLPTIAGGDTVSLSDVSLANVPKTADLTAQKAAETPVDRSYYARMSEGGGALA